MIDFRKLLAVVGTVAAVGFIAGAATGMSAMKNGNYRAEMRAPGQDVAASIAAISDIEAKALRYPLPPTAALDAAASLTVVQGKLRDAAKRLETIKPPPAVAKQHALLVTGVALLQAELPPIIAKLHKGQYAVVATLSGLPGGIDLNSGLKGLKKRGYAIG